MKNVPKPLAKSFFVSLGLMATASVTGTAIRKKIFGSERLLELAKRTSLVFSNEEIHDIIRIVEYLKDAVLLIKDVVEAVGS